MSKKNLVFKLFVLGRLTRFKKKTSNYFNKNVVNINLKDLHKIRLFLKKRGFNQANPIYKLSNIFIYKHILDFIFKKNSKLIFFFSVFYRIKTKKLCNVVKLLENSLYFFSKISKKQTFSVYENMKYTDALFSSFWRLWMPRHRSPVKEHSSKSFLDLSKKILLKKFRIYQALKLCSIKYRLIPTAVFTIVRRTVTVDFRHKIKNDLIVKNKDLLVLPRYSSSSLHKNIDILSNRNEFQFLRKNKVYNKGRYSRTRQNYRTGVYMCIYLSLSTIFGLYFIFYKFTFKFTYLWWLFIYFIFSFFAPKVIQNRLYEPKTVLQKIFGFFNWISLIIKSIR